MQSFRRRRPYRSRGRGTAPADHSGPLVSVIVPVYNVAPYLRECLDSVLAQSIGMDRIELIAVDDGSTDGSGEILDSYAGEHSNVRVFHEPNSGGPGRPRNVGLDHAAGTYVFFVDADDYLGEEALERLVAMADRNNSDVVLGKMVAINGRLLPTRAFRRTRNRARLTEVYTLNVMKLFRRSLIERVGARFDETVAGGEDSPFTAELLLLADTISVVADYDCYYCRDRPGSQTKRVRTEDPADYLARMSQRAQLLARHRPPGAERDRLMVRHIGDMLRPFGRRWLAMMPEDRRRMFDEGTRLLNEWNNPQILARLSPAGALRAYCLQHGLIAAMEAIVDASDSAAYRHPIVEDDRVFARFPHFRDELGIPDSCFEMTRWITLNQSIRHAMVTDQKLILSGEAYVSYVGGDTTVVLKRRLSTEEHRFATTAVPTPGLRDRSVKYPRSGFTAEIDLATARDGAPLPPGPWSVRLVVGTAHIQREAAVQCGKGISRLPTVFQLARRRTRGTMLYRASDQSLRLWMEGNAWLRRVLELAAAHADRATGGRRNGRRRKPMVEAA